MSILTSRITSEHPFAWFLDGVGYEIYLKEQAALLHVLSCMRVERLIQLGGPPLITAMPQFHYVHFDHDLYFPSVGHNVCGDFNELPILTDCADMVVMPHLQELHTNRYRVFSEISRVLRYSGYLVVYGFNPLSFWGVQRILGLSNAVPWCPRFINAQAIIDQVVKHDFVLVGKLHSHAGPYTNLRWSLRDDAASEDISSARFGAVYQLVFQRSTTATLNTQENPFYRRRVMV